MTDRIENRVPVEKVRRLAGELLDLAAECFSNHGCNDLEKPPYFTEAEWQQLAVDFERYNSDGKDPATPLGDWVAMVWCARLLEKGLI